MVLNGAQGGAFLRRRVMQQAQCLIGVHGDDGPIEILGARVCGQQNAAIAPLNATHRRVKPFVFDTVYDALHVLARAAAHGVPLRPIAHLQQAVVVAKADHGGKRELQHLAGRTTPDAGHHGQEIPLAKGLPEALLQQEITERLLQGGLLLPDRNT